MLKETAKTPKASGDPSDTIVSEPTLSDRFTIAEVTEIPVIASCNATSTPKDCPAIAYVSRFQLTDNGRGTSVRFTIACAGRYRLFSAVTLIEHGPGPYRRGTMAV